MNVWVHQQIFIDLGLFCIIIALEDSDVTNYRGVEAVDCVGMQPSVEPACGLCENHKPNRFCGIKRKRIKGLVLCKTLFCERRMMYVRTSRHAIPNCFWRYS